MERYVTMGEPPKPISSGMGGNPPSFLPWCEPEGNAASQAGQVRPLGFRYPLPNLSDASRSSRQSLTSRWTIEIVCAFSWAPCLLVFFLFVRVD